MPTSISEQQLATLNDFHAFCGRHPFRNELRQAVALECCKVLGVKNDITLAAVHARSIAVWLTPPEEAIKNIEDLQNDD